MLVNSVDSAPETASPGALTTNSNPVMASSQAADDGTGFAVILVLAATAFVVLAAALADHLNGLG